MKNIWNFNLDRMTLIKNKDGIIPELQLQLRIPNSKEIQYEALWNWNTSDLNTRKAVIAGVCLYDARWQIEFASPKRNKNQPKARATLALSSGRERAFAKLKQGEIAERIFVPTTLSKYHTSVIRWQAEVIKSLKPEKIIYHIPYNEYKFYIEEIETYTKKNEKILISLINFQQKIKDITESLFKDFNVEYINPMDNGAKTPTESFSFPYLYPEVYNTDHNSLVAVEEYAEFRLNCELLKQKNITIPGIYSVISFPDPYNQKQLIDNEYEIIELNNH